MVATTPPIALNPPDPAIRIRPVQLIDVDYLHRACWPDRPRAPVEQLVHRAQQIAWQGRGLGVIVTGDDRRDIHGYGQLTMWGRGAEISDLMIAEAYRGRGLGTTIIQYLVRAAKEMRAPSVEIGVALSNPKALALYRRLGFVDDHMIIIDLGKGPEQVLYLSLEMPHK